jgi:hypothetical protein
MCVKGAWGGVKSLNFGCTTAFSFVSRPLPHCRFILDMQKDRPDRPIVHPIEIAWVIGGDRWGDTPFCIVQTDQLGVIEVGYFWALFFRYWLILLRILRVLKNLKSG